MTQRTLTVQTPSGPQTRILYSTRYGPVLTSLLGLPIFPWTDATAFAMGDANAPNFRYLNHFFDVDHAQSSQQVLASLTRNQGIPWVNTIAADDNGAALYADISVTPHVTDDQAARCDTPLGTATFAALRLPALDGSRPECNWGSDPDALQPGTFGPSHMPSLLRTDYVTNSNDSYWLSQPRSPLTGYARIIGDEATPRSLRTRSGLTMMEEQLAGGRRMSRQDMQDLLFSDRQYAGELTRSDVVAMCRAFPGGVAPSSAGPTPVRNACDVLAAWDVRDRVDSRGALLFPPVLEPGVQPGAARRRAGRAQRVVAHPLRPEGSGEHPARPADPATAGAAGLRGRDPRSRRGGHPARRPAGRLPEGRPARRQEDPVLGRARHARRLQRDQQHVERLHRVRDAADPRLVVHPDRLVRRHRLPRHPDVADVLAVHEPDQPSPHYTDQTELFSRNAWVTDRFCTRDVVAGTLSTVHLVG
jgi:acyl-homoserine-lactone acylase